MQLAKFPPGAVAVFSIRITSCDAAVRKLDELVHHSLDPSLECHLSDAFSTSLLSAIQEAKFSLVDLNYLLYRCSAEEEADKVCLPLSVPHSHMYGVNVSGVYCVCVCVCVCV